MIGDTVHTASPMESPCTGFSVDAVVSADVARSLDGTVPLGSLGGATVKGKASAITVYTLA